MLPIEQIMTQESPRKILAEDFKRSMSEFPIRGGWGYTQGDACIIDKNDPIVDPSLPFDGVSIEYVFVEKRIYEEMIIFRPEGEKFSGIHWDLVSQNTVHEDDRSFDRLVFDVTALRDQDFAELKAEFEGPNGYGSPGFDLVAHDQKHEDKTVRITREYWFDITSFYGTQTREATSPANPAR